MSKKLKNVKWESVALEGFPANVTDNLHGFVGLEECTQYGLDKESKRPKKKKTPKKRKQVIEEEVLNREIEVPNKREKLSNGFIVENCITASPLGTNEEVKRTKSKKVNNKKAKAIKEERQPKRVLKVKMFKKPDKTTKNKNNKKVKLGEDISQTICNNLTAEDMLTWDEFKLPKPILRGLAELGYNKPTKIQQLSLPAAIHGRRDILGAAETGSGKTLAFGLPILTGIMKLKEKAEAGHDVYEIPYKKSSRKKEKKPEVSNTTLKNKKRNKNITQKPKSKESSEDGYSSAEESENDEPEPEPEASVNDTKESNEEFLKEYDVPVKKKKESSADEGNDSDDSENFIHLSDMLDSDDLADSSDEEKVEHASDDNKESSGNGSDIEEKLDEESSGEEQVNENEQVCGSSSQGVHSPTEHENIVQFVGIGCVKVIDDVEMPGQVAVKTGKPLYALIITPTRELAMQICGHLKAVAKYTGIRIATIVGGMAAVKQERVLRSSPEVVVATPGRLWELVAQGQPHLSQLHCLRFLAVDETDRMVERHHFEELWPLLERLNADEARRAARQNFVFSATLTMVHDLPSHMTAKKVTKRGKIINRKIHKMTAEQKLKKLIDMFGMTEPKVVDITQQNLGTAETLTECRISCPLEQKDVYLYYILKLYPGRTIVFCNSISSVRRLAQVLTILKCRPLPLHAGMQQRQRLKNLERFRDSAVGVLVATDVAARGLDVPGVDHVLHYQVPKTAENYVHRSGRTARASKQGLTILMLEPAEAYHYAKLCHTLNKTSEVPTFPVPAASLAPFKAVVALAREVEALELRRRRAAQAKGWREKAARDMDIIIDEDDVPVTEVDSSINKALKVRKRQLDALMSRPLFPKGFSFKYPTLNDPSALKCSDENALQVMKRALESGELKKEKRKSKNAPLLTLEKALKKK